MTCIKCQLSSSLFFLRLTLTFQWESNFNGSLNIGGVREKLNIVCALDAMVRKLISLICFDIFQSKWYRNALIGMPDDKTNSEKRLLWQTQHFWLTNVKTDQGYQFYLPWRPRHTQNPTSYVFLQCSKFAVKLSLKSKRESEKKRELGNRHLMHVLTLLNTINIQAHQRVQTVVNREAGKPW